MATPPKIQIRAKNRKAECVEAFGIFIVAMKNAALCVLGQIDDDPEK